MASVFLSYDRDDTGKARPIALALEKAGHSVWWDLHVRGGAQFSKVIEEALKAADAVVVLWSKQSVESAWVRDEAAAGRDSGRLVPVSLDDTEPPLGFRQFQTIDLSGWKGRGRIPHLLELLGAVDSLGSVDTASEAPQPIAREDTHRRLRRLLPIGLGALAVIIIAAALFVWRPWGPRSSTPVVAVVAAQQSSEANALARDLLVQLGSLQASDTDALQLVGPSSEIRPNFIFEVSGSSNGEEAGANLALLKGEDRSLLWSKTFQQPAGKEADLRQQLAYSAAQVVQCASEAMSTEGNRLRAETEKLYLNGCAEFAENLGANPGTVVPIFARVVSDAPSFRDGWAKLLLAESAFLSDPTTPEAMRTSLLNHINQARSIHPNLPEIRLAEIGLLPSNAYAERISLADHARQLGPDDPFVLTARASELMKVGRLNEAVIDAARAAELDPLSPSIRNTYISTLAYSGRLAMAKTALDQAERLWPGTSSVEDAKFRYHYRYGDPAEALVLLRTSTDGAGIVDEIHEAFLQARMDPTPEKVDRAAQATNGFFGFLAQVLGEFGRYDELYEIIGPSTGPLKGADSAITFRPALRKFRQDPRFMQVADRLGLVDYWRKSGKWPDFCFEPDLPYDCKEEAAKFAA